MEREITELKETVEHQDKMISILSKQCDDLTDLVKLLSDRLDLQKEQFDVLKTYCDVNSHSIGELGNSINEILRELA